MTALTAALTTALFDFVWQGLVIALLLWIVLFLLRSRSARARYAVSCAALASMSVLPVVTAILAYRAPAAQTVRSLPTAAHAAAIAVPVAIARSAPAWLSRWALPLWALGVLLFSLRLMWAGRQIAALRRRAEPAEAALLALVDRLRDRMLLLRPVRVLVIAAADCPSVVGWFKPVLLLPAATVAGLTPEQLEAVLAHELAHILRYDDLVNMLQSIAETLLFYHPAVWWASSRIRHERELCCDDLAVASCGDAIGYARALTRLERLRLGDPAFALGSGGGSLMYRIARLVGEPRAAQAPSKLPAILAIVLGVACLAFNAPWARGQQPEERGAIITVDSAMDDPGVSVDLGGAGVTHREQVEYPEAAMEKGIQGTVVLEATLDAEGMVSDARVLSGPNELRKAALQSVLQWHFSPDAAGSTRQVTVNFQLPAEQSANGRAILEAKRDRDRIQARINEALAKNMAERAAKLHDVQLAMPLADVEREIGLAEKSVDLGQKSADLQAKMKLLHELQSQLDSAKLANLAPSQQTADLAHNTAELEAKLQLLHDRQAEIVFDEQLKEGREQQLLALEKQAAEFQETARRFQSSSPALGRKVKSIEFSGVNITPELLEKLPVHTGDTLSEESFTKLAKFMQEFDKHLSLYTFTGDDGEVRIRIAAPGK